MQPRRAASRFLDNNASLIRLKIVDYSIIWLVFKATSIDEQSLISSIYKYPIQLNNMYIYIHPADFIDLFIIFTLTFVHL